jgi:hypothetical protein
MLCASCAGASAGMITPCQRPYMGQRTVHRDRQETGGAMDAVHALVIRRDTFASAQRVHTGQRRSRQCRCHDRQLS